MNSTQQNLHHRALRLSKVYRTSEIEIISLLQDIEKNKVH